MADLDIQDDDGINPLSRLKYMRQLVCDIKLSQVSALTVR